ncbi:MAG: ATP-binding cassette domain-containing protein, partial [Bacteroidota bacterium]|nr:ATP-binding cassette domain-containing protein [Bacteroidota bacterium]
PYMEVIEEMTLVEFLAFHQQFKNFLPSFTTKKIIGEINLDSASNKQIRYYSSGMKQRVKLAQAIFSDTAIVLLDEPCSNLDTKGIELYHSLIRQYCKERLVIVCSNDPVEYTFCQKILSVTDFKM